MSDSSLSGSRIPDFINGHDFVESLCNLHYTYQNISETLTGLHLHVHINISNGTSLTILSLSTITWQLILLVEKMYRRTITLKDNASYVRFCGYYSTDLSYKMFAYSVKS